MAKQKEGSLQERIQRLIERRGGYVHKNWGSMISEPGVADLTVCYKGVYLALETKVDNNTPSRAQGIHCRKVQKSGGITAIVWSIEEVKTILQCIDDWYNEWVKFHKLQKYINDCGIDDGTRW